MSGRRLITIWILGAALVAGCQRTPPETVLPQLTFAHLESIPLKVSEIVYRDTYIPPLNSPHIEHLHPLNPAGAIKRWQAQRFQAKGNASGREDRLILALEVASVIEKRLEPSQGIGGWLRNEKDSIYICQIKLHVMYEGYQIPPLALQTTVNVEQGVLESASVNERDLIYLQVVELAVRKLDEEVIKLMANEFAHITVNPDSFSQ